MREKSGNRVGFRTAALLLWALVGASPAIAQEMTTSLVDIHQGSPLSDRARGLGNGGYELQNGTFVSFNQWYRAT